MEDHHYPQMASAAKGKRTKRQKPHSPTPFEVVPVRTATTTISNDMWPSTEEEEDMANCLILLAQGQSKASTTSPDQRSNHVNAGSTHDNNIINKEDEHYYYYPHPPPPPQQQQPVKYNSKRYLETVTATGGNKAGYYVYECKTCNRTFPSFQALGGHRASHKKPKVGGGGGDHSALFPSVQDKKQLFTLLPPSSPSDHHNGEDQGGHFRKTSSLSLHLSNNNGNSSKVHECSICGAEFMSGQALGGHMRRHRAAPNNIHIGGTTNLYSNKSPIIVGTPNITTLSLTPLIDKLELEIEERQHTPADKEVLSLDLDLNLPASGQDQETTAMALLENNNKLQQIDNHTKKTSQPSSSSSAKVFSASPTLVDCHY